MSFLGDFIRSLPASLPISTLLPLAQAEMWQKNPPLAAMTSLALSARFDVEDYLARYDDVLASDYDPIQHFVLHGLHEGRMFNDRATRTGQSCDAAIYTSDGNVCQQILGLTERPAVGELARRLDNYDVISLDIFDTALLRNVEFPRDIFEIMALEIEWSDFARARPRAEVDARENKMREEGHSEITLAEIYQLLEQHHGLDSAWMQREIELEKSMIQANPYILSLYKRLQGMGKILVFSSDMYLPKTVIEEMLARSGYDGYHNLYLSNALKLRKGDGSLQKKLLADFPGLRIIHIGDNQWGDVKQSLDVGLDAVLHKDCRPEQRAFYMNNMAGSLIQALINNTINNGLFAGSVHFAHGFCCGGPLAAGYCQHVNLVARSVKADKILFCGRDCYLVQRIYDAHFREYSNVYVETSRIALMLLSARRYADDLLHRFVLRYWDEAGAQLTQEQLLEQTGFGYLAQYLEESGLSRFTFCRDARKDVFRSFFLSHLDEIEAESLNSIKAAKRYFSEALEGAASVVIADVGWSGSCIEALANFIKCEIDPRVKITGTLVCASASRSVADKIQLGKLVPYVSGPGFNGEIHSFLYPPKTSSIELDKRRLPLEYLFSAPVASILAYRDCEKYGAGVARDTNTPVNMAEISEMHRGILEFNSRFASVCRNIKMPDIPGATAFAHLLRRLRDDEYLNAVYGNFCYDACTLPGSDYRRRFSSILPAQSATIIHLDAARKYILFITLELSYTGTPHSLLRTARIVRKLGFEPIIWSPKDGPFRNELERENMLVQIVATDEIETESNLKTLGMCCLAWCNTVITARYVDILRKHLPTVWFIREAQNLQILCSNDPERLRVLQEFENIYCPSNYAREAINKFTSQSVNVLHNCVPDESEWATEYVPGSGVKTKFVQLGTLELRKGYDVLVKAFLSLPESYRSRSELHFAGGFISFAAPFCEWLFQTTERHADIHYHGQIRDTRAKIRLLSEMDVVVVASRDESCSLVALEGAMLGRPLIVTENVGAKYMVGAENGLVVQTADVKALRAAMMEMIDKGACLAEMGKASRVMYEWKAGMASHEEDIKKLLRKCCPAAFPDMIQPVVISLTSYPARMDTIMPCIESLLEQDYPNFSLHLWLAEEQFPCREACLPADLVDLAEEGGIALHWVRDDLKPHKKYLYAMRQYPDLPVILVDDDVVYARDMASRLMESYESHPNCVSCHRANMMMFNQDGTLRNYLTWLMDYRHLVDTPSMRLVPTGVGGVLYPPGILPEEAFDTETIKKVCLPVDDLWLKMMTVLNGHPSVLVKNNRPVTEISGSQNTALWRSNVIGGGNDKYLNSICEHLTNCFPEFSETLCNIRNGLVAV